MDSSANNFLLRVKLYILDKMATGRCASYLLSMGIFLTAARAANLAVKSNSQVFDLTWKAACLRMNTLVFAANVAKTRINENVTVICFILLPLPHKFLFHILCSYVGQIFRLTVSQNG